MKLIYSPDTLQETNGELAALIGGKGMALFTLYNAGLPVARPICIGTSGYELFVEQNQLREKINLYLHRKDLKEMHGGEDHGKISPINQNQLYFPGHLRISAL